jgi:hypothetical protein
LATLKLENKLKNRFKTTEIVKDPIKDGDYTIWTKLDGVDCHIQLNLAEDIPELEKSIPIGRFPYTPSI